MIDSEKLKQDSEKEQPIKTGELKDVKRTKKKDNSNREKVLQERKTGGDSEIPIFGPTRMEFLDVE